MLLPLENFFKNSFRARKIPRSQDCRGLFYSSQLTVALVSLFEVFANARTHMYYRLTEASRGTFIEFRTEQRKLQTAGLSSPNVAISIVDGEGRRADEMRTGEILVRGDHIAVGYWQDDKLNMERCTKDRCLRTGDYGFLDEEGYLHLLGRRDQTIDMGGVKISPLEMEEKIHEAYPDWQVCVLGIPDPAGMVGEIPALCHISRDGEKLPLLNFDRSSQIDSNERKLLQMRRSAL
jgi:long-chain acyl-CoA synthetase